MSCDAATALLRAIRPNHLAGFAVEELKSRGWASATFTGARHELRLRFEGEDAAAAAERLLDGLSEREFDLRGHLLADIRMVEREDCVGPHGKTLVRVALEALTLEAD